MIKLNNEYGLYHLRDSNTLSLNHRTTSLDDNRSEPQNGMEEREGKSLGQKVVDYLVPSLNSTVDSVQRASEAVTNSFEHITPRVEDILDSIQVMSDKLQGFYSGSGDILKSMQRPVRVLLELYIVIHSDEKIKTASLLLLTVDCIPPLVKLVKEYVQNQIAAGGELEYQASDDVVSLLRQVLNFVFGTRLFLGDDCSSETIRAMNAKFLLMRNLTQFMSGGLEMLTQAFNWLYQKVTGLPFNITPDESECVEMYNVLLDHILNYSQTLTRSVSTYQQYRRLDQLVKTVDAVKERLVTYPRLVALHNNLNRYVEPLREHLVLRQQAEARGAKRQVPVALGLFGKPNQGKSLCLNYISNILWQSFYPDKPYEMAVFTPDSSLEFVNGYKEQPIWIQDEMFTTNNQEMLAMETRNYMSYINNCPHALNMADLKDKGNTMFTSEFFLFTTNRLNYAQNQGFGITDVRALHRRIHLFYEVSLKGQPTDDLVRPDLWAFQQYQSDGNNFVPVGEPVDYKCVLKQVVELYQKHLVEKSKVQDVDLGDVEFVRSRTNPSILDSLGVLPLPSERVDIRRDLANGSVTSILAGPDGSCQYIYDQDSSLVEIHGGVVPIRTRQSKLFSEVYGDVVSDIMERISRIRDFLNKVSWVQLIPLATTTFAIASVAWWRKGGEKNPTGCGNATFHDQSGMFHAKKIPKTTMSFVRFQDSYGTKPNYHDVGEWVERNIVQVTAYYDDDKQYKMFGLMVNENTLLLNKHFVERFETFDNVRCEIKTNVEQIVTFNLQDVPILKSDQLDYCFVRLAIRIPRIRDVSKRFSDLHDLPYSFDSSITFRLTGQKLVTLLTPTLNLKHLGQGTDVERLVYCTVVPNKSGDCGLPYLVNYNGLSIIGIHTGALIDQKDTSALVVVTREAVDCALQQLSSVEPQALEQYTSYSRSTYKEIWHPPKLLEVYKEIGEEPRQPSLMMPKDDVDPYTNGVAKIVKDTPFHIDDKCVQAAMELNDVYKSLYHDKIDPFMTEQQAIMGLVSENKYEELGIDPCKSPGFPYRNFHLSRRDLIQEGTLIGLARKNYDARLKEKFSQAPLYLDFLKDELRTPQKVANGDTRLISACPLEYLVFHRQLFARFNAFIMSCHNVADIKIGIDPHSSDWGTLYYNCAGRPYVIAGDFSGFDRTIPKGAQELFKILYWSYIEYHAGPGPYVISGVQFTREDINNIIDQFVEAEHASLGNRYKATHGNPSGCVITSVFNSIVVDCLIRAMFGKYNPEIAVFGDDHMIGFKEKPPVDALDFRSFLEGYGLVYTAAKKGTELTPFTENPTFLKRSFVVTQFSKVKAPLNLCSILDVLYWVRTKGNSSVTDNLVQRLKTVYFELQHYIPQDVEFILDIMRDLINHYNLSEELIFARELVNLELSMSYLTKPTGVVTLTPGVLYQMDSAEQTREPVLDNKQEDPKVDDQDKLMTVTSNAPIVEAGELGPQRDLSLPYPVQGFYEQLSREYVIGTFTWSTQDSLGQELASFKFPYDLYRVPRIQQLLARWQYLRAGVEVILRPAANWSMYGSLMMSALPCSPDMTIKPMGERNGDVYQAYNNNHVIMSAHDSTEARLTQGYASPYQCMPVRKMSENDKDFWTTHIGVFKVFVLVPLQNGLQSDATTQLTVKVYARFCDPQVTGPTDQVLIYQANDDDCGAPQPSPETVAVAKTGVPKTLAKVLDVGEAVSGAINKVIPNPITSSITPLFGLVKKIVPVVRSITGFSKPNNPHNVERVIQQMIPSSAVCEGVDAVEHLGCCAESAVTTDQEVFSGCRVITDMLMLAKIWSLIGIHQVQPSARPGERIFNYQVRPMDCHELPAVPHMSTTYDNGGVTNTYTYHNAKRVQPSWLSHVASFYKWWRGSIKYKVHFYASPWHNARLRLVWTPTPFSMSAEDQDLSYGDLYSTQIEISRGDQEIEFVVPYCSYNHFLAVDHNHGLDEDFANGYLSLFLLSDVTTNNKDASIYVTVSIAAGDDFEFGWFSPQDWNRYITFQDKGFQMQTTGNLIQSDHVTDVLAMLHRYQTYSMQVTPYATNPVYFFPYVYTDSDGYRPDQMNPENYTTWQQRLLSTFQFWRGSYRLRVWHANASAPSYLTISGANVEFSGASISSQEWGTGATSTSVSYNPTVAVNIPQYSNNLYQFVCYSDKIPHNVDVIRPSVHSTLLYDGEDRPKVRVLVTCAVGDDFTLGQPLCPARVVTYDSEISKTEIDKDIQIQRSVTVINGLTGDSIPVHLTTNSIGVNVEGGSLDSIRNPVTVDAINGTVSAVVSGNVGVRQENSAVPFLVQINGQQHPLEVQGTGQAGAPMIPVSISGPVVVDTTAPLPVALMAAEAKKAGNPVFRPLTGMRYIVDDVTGVDGFGLCAVAGGMDYSGCEHPVSNPDPSDWSAYRAVPITLMSARGRQDGVPLQPTITGLVNAVLTGAEMSHCELFPANQNGTISTGARMVGGGDHAVSNLGHIGTVGTTGW